MNQSTSAASLQKTLPVPFSFVEVRFIHVLSRRVPSLVAQKRAIILYCVQQSHLQGGGNINSPRQRNHQHRSANQHKEASTCRTVVVMVICWSTVPVGRSLCLSELPLSSAQGTLLWTILLCRELEVLEDAVHVEGMVALPPH